MPQQYFMCGCGWLGLPLARRLQVQGHDVHGTSTRATQCAYLNSQGISAYPLCVSKDTQQDFSLVDYAQAIQAMRASTWVLLNIPPKRRDLHEQPFLNNMKGLVDAILQQNIHTNILFISTTSVFGPVGADLVELDETSSTNPHTASGRVHAALELFLLRHYPKQSCVLRLAGLINETRHPVTSICQKDTFTNGQQRVNLIHQKDAVTIIEAIFAQNQRGKIFHGCAPEHPTRLDYYRQSAKVKGLQFPWYDSQESTLQHAGKTILSKKTQQILGFDYKYKSPYDML